jgi:hypothetical protein
VDGADRSGGRGRLAGERGGADARRRRKAQREKQKEGGDGGRRLTPGRRHLGPTCRCPGVVAVGGRRAGASWAVLGWKGKRRGCRGVREKEMEVAQRTSRAWARGPEAIPPSPFLFSPNPLSKLDSNLNADSNLKSHSDKFQIKPIELRVSHTNIFIFPRNFHLAQNKSRN